MAAEIVVLIPRNAFKALLMGLAILASAKDIESTESVQLSTYYPAPSGVYQQMLTTGNTDLAIAPGGTVGIGTTTPLPGYQLDVEGNEYVNENLSIGPNHALYLKHAPYIKNGGPWGKLIGVQAGSPQGASYNPYCLW